MEYVIETKELTKRYGSKTAVNHISMHVKKGAIYGLIGKNGAGKTSLMKLILGLTTPNEGEISLLNGSNIYQARRKTGSLIEAPALYKNETAFENMKRFSLISPASDKEIRELLKIVGLDNTKKKKAGEFSLGMRQRLGIAIALLGHPDLLILDEPINGLDPAGIKEIRDIILRLNHSGVTFVISSHLLDELGKIATDYGIVSGGNLIEEISQKNLEERCRASLRIVTDNTDKAVSVLKSWNKNIKLETLGTDISILSEIEDSSYINHMLVSSGIKVYEVKNESIGFEDFFIERLGR